MADFNPERISVVGEDEPVEIIGLKELQDFEIELGLPGRYRFASPLLMGIKNASRTRLDSRHRTGFQGSQPDPYEYQDESVIGIRAEEAKRLLADLESGKVAIFGIGDRSIELFNIFCDDLEIEEISVDDYY